MDQGRHLASIRHLFFETILAHQYIDFVEHLCRELRVRFLFCHCAFLRHVLSLSLGIAAAISYAHRVLRLGAVALPSRHQCRKTHLRLIQQLPGPVLPTSLSFVFFYIQVIRPRRCSIRRVRFRRPHSFLSMPVSVLKITCS